MRTAAVILAGLATLIPCSSLAQPPGPLAGPAATLQGAPRTAQVLHVLELPRSRIDGLRPVELSALAWDPGREQLWAASDRGSVFVWQVQPQAPALWRPLRALRVRRPAPAADAAVKGEPPSDEVNAETLAWRTPANTAAGATGPATAGLWLGSEHEAAAWQLDDEGRVQATQPWPGALRGAKPGAQHGIEAMDWHPTHGLLAARQRPVRNGPGGTETGAASRTRWHALHAQGQLWWFAAAGASSQLKAIETLGSQGLLVLERTGQGVGQDAGFMPVLRWLSLQDCGGERVCTPHTLRFEPALPAAVHNYEGLACTAAGLCWLVSDAEGRAGTPTQVLVLQLKP